MSTDISHIKFEYGATRDSDKKWPSTMDELVRGWLSFQELQTTGREKESEEFWWAFEAADQLCSEYPDLAIEFILETLAADLSPIVLASLAAGPLEDLLVRQGPAVIDQIEMESRQNPKFRHLLGGVWSAKPSDIWARVLIAAPERW